MYSNVDSLLNKRKEILALIELHKPLVVGLVEIKPKNCKYQVQECEIAINDYQLFHNLDHPGRGIGLYLHNSLNPALCEDLNKSNFEEVVFVECRLSGNDSLLVGLFYRSPNSLEQNNEKLLKVLRETGNSKRHSHILLLGDFNYREIEWENETCNTGENHPAYKFLDATRDAFLIQHQKTHTRHRQGQESSLLDLVFTNEEGMINDIETTASVGKSDHATLIIDFKCYHQTENITTQRKHHNTAILI